MPTTSTINSGKPAKRKCYVQHYSPWSVATVC